MRSISSGGNREFIMSVKILWMEKERVKLLAGTLVRLLSTLPVIAG